MTTDASHGCALMVTLSKRLHTVGIGDTNGEQMPFRLGYQIVAKTLPSFGANVHAILRL